MSDLVLALDEIGEISDRVERIERMLLEMRSELAEQRAAEEIPVPASVAAAALYGKDSNAHRQRLWRGRQSGLYREGVECCNDNGLWKFYIKACKERMATPRWKR